MENRGPMSLLLHPQDGAELGIQDGDPVTAWNDLAEVEFKAVFTDQIAKKNSSSIRRVQLLYYRAAFSGKCLKS